MNVNSVLQLYWATLWPLFIFLLIFFLAAILKVYFEFTFKNWQRKSKFDAGGKWRSDKELTNWLAELSPKEFEEQTAEMFKRLGYEVKVTGRSHDIGVDVEMEKNGKKSIVQCKHYTSKVGRPELARFYGDLAHHLADDGFFVTTNYFTLDAKKYADDKPIELVDGSMLIKYMKDAKMGFLSNPENNFCPKCGSILVDRSGKYGKFIGCSTYPKCDYTKS
jgi:restriction system protein